MNFLPGTNVRVTNTTHARYGCVGTIEKRHNETHRDYAEVRFPLQFPDDEPILIRRDQLAE